MATKLKEIISALIVSVFIKNNLSCIKIAFEIRFLSVYSGEKWRGQNSISNLICVQ